MTEQANDPNEFDDTDSDFGEDAPSNPADDADANPFGEGEDYGDGTDNDEGGDDAWELPPEPVGVLRGHTTAKRWANDTNKIIVSVQITEPPFQSSETLEMWFDMSKAADIKRLCRFAAALGVTIKQSGRRISFPGGVEQAFHEKPGRFLVASWDKDDGTSEPQVAKWLPKEGKSRAWDEHMAALAETDNSYSDAQMKILKGCPGVLPEDF